MSDQTRLGGDHIAALDGLRGVAAIAVMVLHFSISLGDLGAMPKAYLAVDFFFVLSGYVLALAYERRLKQPGFLLPFARLRAIRLYPLIPLGMILGFIAYFARNFLSPDKHVSPTTMLMALAFAFLLLPFGRIPGATEENDFPYDGTIWSLMFEIIANVVYAVAAPLLRNGVLAVVLIVSGAGLAMACWQWGMIHHGFEKQYFAYGLLRVTFPFFAGVAIYRLFDQRGVSLPALPFWLIAALLLLTFAPSEAMVPRLYDAVCVILVFPLLVAAGRRATVGAGSRGIALWFGRLSYPLYVLHPPFTMISTFIYNRFALSEGQRWMVLLGGCGGAILFSALVLVFYDEPVRMMLRRGKRVPAAAE